MPSELIVNAVAELSLKDLRALISEGGMKTDGCIDKSLYGDYATNHVPPEYSADLTLSQLLFDDMLTLGGRVSHIGPRAIGHGDVTAQGASQFISQVNWKPYTLVDLFADIEINENLTTSLSVIPEIEASFDVVEAFAEVEIPLLETVTAQLAARVADYSTIGTISSYNVGGYWEPTDTLRFRTQYSRSQRAPTITEFYSAPRQDADDLRDPCDGLRPDGSGVTAPPGTGFDPAVIASNCLSNPGIQAFFADPNNAGQPFEFDGSVNAPNAGNNTLTEETADTFTIGAVWAPSFAEDLVFIVDYYNIKVEKESRSDYWLFKECQLPPPIFERETTIERFDSHGRVDV